MYSSKAAAAAEADDQVQSVKPKNPMKPDAGIGEVANMESLKTKIKICKNQTTRTVNKFLNRGEVELSEEQCQVILSKLETKLGQLDDLFQNRYALLPNDEAVDAQLAEDEQYLDMLLDAKVGLLEYINLCKENKRDRTLNTPIASTPIQTVTASSSGLPHLNLGLPKLVIPKFRDNTKDPFAFFRFKNSFSNSLDHIEGTTDSVKLIYLKSYVEGRALALIENLEISDESLTTAWNLLEEEFLDIDFLTNSSVESIFNHKPCSSLEENTDFVTFVKSRLAELAKLGIDLTSANSAGTFLISNIVRNKLFNPFLKELCRKLSFNYPTIAEILENAVSVTKLIRPREIKPSSDKPFDKFKPFVKNERKPLVPQYQVNKNAYAPQYQASKNYSFARPVAPQRSNVPPTVKAHGMGATPFEPRGNNSNVPACKFCRSPAHSSLRCPKFRSVKERKDQAYKLGLCCHCLSAKHRTQHCLSLTEGLPFECTGCHSNRHVSPLCTSPTLSMTMNKVRQKEGEAL